MFPDFALTTRRLHRMGLLAAALVATVAGQAFATDIIDGQVKLIPREESATIGFTNGSFVAAPIPFRNPTIGTGLALGGGYLFKDEARSATSFLGAGGFKTDNGSYGYGLAGNVVLGDNRWKFSGFLGQVELTYDLYTLLGIREIDQSGSIAKVELAYGVTPELSFGVIGRYLDTTIVTDRTLPAELLADLGDATVIGLGLAGDLDRRDDTIYPTDGSHLSLVLYNNQFDGLRTRDYQKGILLYDTYHRLGDKGVVAARGALCGATDETPFFDLCSLGGTDAMRGFPVTQYLDNRLASAQVEYRRVFAGRFGGVAFAGAGTVGADTGELSLDTAHAAAGVGARIRLSRTFPVDFSIDASWNDEDEQLLYIYVGQRFSRTGAHTMTLAIIIAASVVGVFVVYFAARRLAGPDVPDATRELSGAVGFRIAGLHGLIIALVFAQLALVFRNLEAELIEEAQTVSSIYLDARRHGGDGAATIAEAARQYVDLVLERDWDDMRAGKAASDDEAETAIATIYDGALTLSHATPVEDSLRDELLHNVRHLSDLRFAREGQTQSQKGFAFWFAAISGLVLMSACFFAYQPTRKNLALLAAFGLYNGIVFALIVAYTNPFTAPGALRATAFEQVRAAMDG